MSSGIRRLFVGILAIGLTGCSIPLRPAAGTPAVKSKLSKRFPPKELEVNQPQIQSIPVPADPELEQQIKDVQNALGAIYQEMVRRKDALKKTEDPTAKTALYDEFERLRKDRDDLEALLHDLIDEAKASERTAIDEALARARWLERQQEYQQQKEELIRDRQQ